MVKANDSTPATDIHPRGGPVTRAIQAMHNEPEPPRRDALRALLAGAAIIPLTLCASASAVVVQADAELIQTVDRILTLLDRAEHVLSDEEEWTRLINDADDLMAIAISLPATTSEGLAAKARLLRSRYPAEGPLADRYDAGERIVQSLISDLIRQGGRA